MKMHLAARVPNEGARKLAQWVMLLPGGLDAAAKALGASTDVLLRIVEGEMVPGLALGTRLANRISLRARDFQRPAAGGWFDAAEWHAKAA